MPDLTKLEFCILYGVLVDQTFRTVRFANPPASHEKSETNCTDLRIDLGLASNAKWPEMQGCMGRRHHLQPIQPNPPLQFAREKNIYE